MSEETKSRSQRFFDGLWRVNAVLIFLVMAGIAITFVVIVSQEIGFRKANEKKAESAITVAEEGDSKPRMHLASASASNYPGTDVIRINLVATVDHSGIGSGGYSSETRNVLFVTPGDSNGKWLLPDNDHVISESTDIDEANVQNSEYDSPQKQRTVATVAFVTTSGENKGDLGRIILFSPAGSKIVQVADGANQVLHSFFAAGRLNILYEKGKRLTQVSYDAATLEKRGETQVNIPQPR